MVSKNRKMISKNRENDVFTFPRFCSIFCVDNSQIFWCSHKYLWSIRFIPHSFWDICEGSEFFSHTFVYLCVYRHANLCSGLRAILSPQFIKKVAILEHSSQRDPNPRPLRILSFWIWCSTNYAMSRWWRILLLWLKQL